MALNLKVFIYQTFFLFHSIKHISPFICMYNCDSISSFPYVYIHGESHNIYMHTFNKVCSGFLRTLFQKVLSFCLDVQFQEFKDKQYPGSLNCCNKLFCIKVDFEHVKYSTEFFKEVKILYFSFYCRKIENP